MVCKRKKFLETRLESPDLVAIEHSKKIMGQIEDYRSLVENSRTVVSLRLSGDHSAEAPSLQVEVEEYGPVELIGGKLHGARVLEVGDSYEFIERVGSQHMLVAPPDADALIPLMEGQMLSSTRRSIGFANAMDRFVLRYSQGPEDLPLVSFNHPVAYLCAFVSMCTVGSLECLLAAAGSRTGCPQA